MVDLQKEQAKLYGYAEFKKSEPSPANIIMDVLQDKDLESAAREQLLRAVEFLKSGNAFGAASEIDTTIISSSLSFEQMLWLNEARRLITLKGKNAAPFDLEKAQAALWGYGKEQKV